MAVLASQLVKRKKEHVFAEGYEIDTATELTGGIAGDEEVLHIYGQDDPIIDMNTNNGTLSITVYDKKENNKLLDALQRIDSATTTDFKYDWANVYEISVWANRFNATNTEYTRSVIYRNFLPVPGMTSGDTNAKGQRTFAGNSGIPKEYSQPILGEKLALTTGATGTSWTTQLAKQTPVAVPTLTVEPGTAAASVFYAVRVVAVNEQRDGTSLTHFDSEDLQITTTMVSVSGLVTINGAASPTGDLGKLSWATHVYVNYLYNKNQGVYPTVKPNAMFENI